MKDPYFANPGISASFLKECHKSDFDGWNYLHNPKPATDAMDFGSAVHIALLEPERFGSLVAVSPKFDRRTKQGKADFEAFEIQSQGKIVITDEENASIVRIVARCKSIPIIAEALSTFEKEKVFTWEMGGLQCKAKLDLVDIANNVIIDVKTTRSADPSAFVRQAIDLRYDLQLGHYSYAVNGLSTVYAIAIESDTEQVSCIDLTDIVHSPFTEGRYQQALNAALRVREMKECPLKYGTEIVRASLPKWALEAV